MVTAGEKDIENQGFTMEEENGSSCQTSPQDKRELVYELMGIIQTVSSYAEYRRTQRKESRNLVRRMKLLLPLLEEIRDFEEQIPESGIECLVKMKKAFHSAKKLLKSCHGGSKLYLALESEAVMRRFHSVYEKLSHALDGMPYEELGISDEEKEQVELMLVQFKRARKRIDTQDMELAMDLMVSLSTENDRNADSASIERLANKLELHTVEDLKAETISIRKVIKERRAQNAESTQQIIDLLNKLKRLAGMEETGIFDEPVIPKALEKSTSLAIPNEFLCPITLQIMTDPVIVSTGQTYERESIQHWLDTNHRTCPKTGETLTHLSLAPNFALKNLIEEWCLKNNFQLPTKQASTNPESPSAGSDEKLLSLIEDLSSCHLEVQRKAVTNIRMLSKENPEKRTFIANSGGIPSIVQLVSYPDSKIQEHAVTALLNLSIDESNKKLISKENAIPAIIEVLQNGSVGAKENSAAALFSLSMLDENKVAIGSLNGIPPLIDLLKNGTIRGKKDAITALFNLCFNHTNKSIAIQAGIVAPLLQLLEEKHLDMVDETLSILLVLTTHPEGRQEVGKLSFIETLVNLIRDGTPKNKECSAAVLLELSTHNSNLMLAALQYGVYEHLVEIGKEGTDRGQRKAKSILQLMTKTEQIPY
ncbi:U-box domain-containing protein 15 [Nicotiana tabacum]|uniref:RING-type E3 ubiquitin transferase n=2 Tax=Nicotiana TaxID=4085 RepID=A0A1S4BBP3_TOBAC|nr:PREDICTED: U-box domain-containing protein 15 [Nicotiana sylvestris]XP_016486350.1 PREDICTED: U-box domain-containing protein 15-like [Nicotiana tabacum]